MKESEWGSCSLRAQGSLSVQKAALRAKMAAISSSMEARAGGSSPEQLKGTHLASLIFESASVFAFSSMRGEPDTSPVFSLAIEGGKTLLLPRIRGRNLDFITFSGKRSELKENRFGILEPSSGSCLFSANSDNPAKREESAKAALLFPALVLVPGLAFSRKGERLGRGQGFYDRFLHELSRRFPRTRFRFAVAAFCFPHQIVESVPAESADFIMDCIALPDGSIIKARKNFSF